MGTGITMSEGAYDPATKTFTHTADRRNDPGYENQGDAFEGYENPGGQEARTVEIN